MTYGKEQIYYRTIQHDILQYQKASVFWGKLKVENWAKLASVSVDTAERDIKTLVSSGILVPQPGRFRDVAYGIRVSKDILLIPGPSGEDGTKASERSLSGANWL